MAEMTAQDTITILNRLDLQVKQLQQERAAFAYVGDILKKFEEARRGLEGADRTRLELEAVLSGLRERIHNEESALRKPFVVERVALTAEIAELQSRASQAKERTREAEQNLAEAERHYSERAAGFDVEIKGKGEMLSALEASLESLKKKHGLV